MSAKMVDVTIHINESITHTDRESLRDKLLKKSGVMAAVYHDEKPRLMIIEYDPDTISTGDILKTVKSTGVHAELVGL